MSCADFMQWAIECGARHFGVTVAECLDEGGKGLFATTEFRENETLICIPPELIITAGLIADMPRYHEVFKRYRLNPFEALVYFFLMEDQKNSEWTPYLKVLPETFSTPAILYPILEPEDFPFNLRKSWYEQKNELKAMYKKFTAMLPDDTSWSRFLWAWHVVNTRCIYRENKPHPLIDNSQGDALAIVPLIDMLNHSNENQCCAIWDNKSNFYKIVASRPIHEGEQIFICYGSHTNGSLWIEYGFYLKYNVCNKVEISLEDFMRFASIAGINFSDSHRKVVLQANFPCSVYATDVKPNFGFKANMALLTMDGSKLEHWAKVIYEEAEAVNDKAVLEIVRLLRDEMIKGRNKSPQEVHWLWTEQIALLDTLLSCE